MRLFCLLVHMYLIFTMPLHEGEITDTKYGLLGAAIESPPSSDPALLFMAKSNIFFHCNGKEIDQDNVQ